MKPLSYMSEQAADYVAEIRKAATLPELLAVLSDYRTLFPDALDAAPKTLSEFDAFKKGLTLETKGVFAGEEFVERYGSLMMPEIGVRVGAVAKFFGVPWGCAFFRCKDEGYIVVRDGLSYWVGKPS